MFAARVRGLVAILLLTTAVGWAEEAPSAPAGKWVLVLHGGAGNPPEGLPDEKLDDFKREVLKTLSDSLRTGREILSDGGTAVDAVEAVVRVMEDDPNLNAGRGSVLNIDGGFELHASIMDGKTRDAGAVAAIDNVRNPISLARLVMDKTDFVLLIGEGARRFSRDMKVDQVEPDYFRTELRQQNWLKAKSEGPSGDFSHWDRDQPSDVDNIGTVGAVALDQHGNLAAATSTGGVAHKRFGRMGDSSIIGAGNFADNRTCAVSCTGRGEHFIKNAVAFHVAALMRYKGLSLEEATQFVIEDVLEEGSGGLIALDRKGNVSMHFNRDGMRRGVADSDGRFEVQYWK